MAVSAYKIESGQRVERLFECAAFDAMQASGGTWTEIWRDCDQYTMRRRTQWPFASGPKAYLVANTAVADTRLRHRKYFPSDGDNFTSELDLSDTNSGVLPTDTCLWMEVWQNGKKLPCEAYSTNFGTSIVTINAAWLVPGAAYEVIFWATPVGGVVVQT